MAHFAKLENNLVTQVIVLSNDVCGEPTLDFPETETVGCAFIANTLKFAGVWKQTSFNNNFRKQYCGVGFTYFADADVFVAPQPYASWTLDSNHDWQPPTPMPSDASMENLYEWSEEDLEWVAI
jgi:hypothetical protein